MKAEDFIVKKRPRLASITKHQKVELADYERRLALMQSTLQAIQQAYLEHVPPGFNRRGFPWDDQ